MTAHLWDGRNVVYRFYAADGLCLYVGLTGNFRHRMTAHGKQSPWAAEVARTRITIHPSRRVAVLVEAEEISRLRPKHNVTQPNPASPHTKLVLGAVLRTFRQIAGVNAAELSEFLGISRTYLMNIEAGRRALPLALVPVAAKRLGIPPIVLSYHGHTGAMPTEDAA